MKTRKRLSIIFVALVLVLGLTTSAMASVGIAWVGAYNTEPYTVHIYYWDGSTTRQISDHWHLNYSPSLHNGQIAWQGGYYFLWYIYYWDGSTIRQITDQPGGPAFPYPPSLHNGQIAWFGANGIYFWDGSTITILNASGAYPAGDPSLYNGQIAWTSVNGVYYWDGSTIRQIYAGASWQRDASLYNGTIAWSCYDGWGGDEIYYWDGSTIRQITNYGVSTSTYVNRYPSLHNGQIAWEGGEHPGPFEIYFWDGSTIRQITDNSAISNGGASLHNGHIAWVGFDGNDREIYYWDGSTITQITDNSLIETYSPSLGSLGSPVSEPPIAHAGPDQAVVEIGTTIELDGSQSYDPDGDAITYSWTIIEKPEGSGVILSDPTIVNPTFVPDVHGDYVILLEVSDTWASSDPDDTVTVNFDNVKPVAVCGVNQSVVQGDTVYFNGRDSWDANGDSLTYGWSFVSKPEGSLAEFDDPTLAETSLETDRPGQYIVSLVVNDGLLDSDACEVIIGAISHENATTKKLQETITAINALDDIVFKSKNMKNPLTNKILAALEKVDQGLYQEALDKLEHDILGKTDGCNETGAPDKNDWIRDCDAQNEVYPVVMEAIELLENLI